MEKIGFIFLVEIEMLDSIEYEGDIFTIPGTVMLDRVLGDSIKIFKAKSYNII